MDNRDYMWVQRAYMQTLMFYETLLIFKFIKNILNSYIMLFFLLILKSSRHFHCSRKIILKVLKKKMIPLS